jgi:ubiquinone/menaquinone biosynthesis C-methylase UbiE
MTSTTTYVLTGGGAELERLRLQARVWEPDAEVLLDRIGVRPGWTCLDLGCGAVGILGPLSRRVGPTGRVVGVDLDPRQLAAARALVREEGLGGVEVLERDAYATGLPAASFDLVHVRFLFAPAGRDEALLAEMLRLVRPGGILAVQEPDSASWACSPPHPAWDRLQRLVLAVFARQGGDFDAGRRTYGLLRRAGLEAVQVRAAVLALQDGHPYRRLPVQLAASLRRRILEGGLLDEAELEDLIAAGEEVAADPERYVTTFVLTQVWGRAPLPPGYRRDGADRPDRQD